MQIKRKHHNRSITGLRMFKVTGTNPSVHCGKCLQCLQGPAPTNPAVAGLVLTTTRLSSKWLSKNIKCKMHGCHQHARTNSTSCSGCHHRSFQVFTRNHYHFMAPAKQGSTTLALVLGHSHDRVPAVGWTPDHHAHGNAGSTNHKTTAGQSSHIHTSGGPSDWAITARSSFTFTALAMKGRSNPAITSNKDSHALAHTNGSSSSAVPSTVGNICLHAHATEKQDGQVLPTA